LWLIISDSNTIVQIKIMLLGAQAFFNNNLLTIYSINPAQVFVKLPAAIIYFRTLKLVD
jgi:hypothetical protein